MPRPDASTPPPAELVAATAGRTAPTALRGTEGQVRWAETIRAGLLRQARRAGRLDLVPVLLSTADATWFVANRDRALDRLHWPALSQTDSQATR